MKLHLWPSVTLKNSSLPASSRAAQRLLGISLLLLAAASGAQAAAYTKADTTTMTNGSDWSPTGWTTAVTTGTMTFDTTLSAANALNLTLGSNASFSRLIFGTMNGPVTIAGAGTMTLTGASLYTLDMSAASQDVTINVALGTAQGSSHFNVASGRTLTLGGGGYLAAYMADGAGLVRLEASTAKVFQTALASFVTAGNTTNNTGGLLIGNNATLRAAFSGNGWHIGYGAGGLVRVDGSGAGIDVNIGNVRVGRSLSANQTGKLLLVSGSIFNSAAPGNGTFVVGFGNTAANTRSTFEMQGGTVNLPSNDLYINQSGGTVASTTGEYLMKGGVALLKGIVFGNSATSGTGVLNMTGGELYLGTDGMKHQGTSASAYSVILASGTLGAAADWSSSLNMKTREGFIITAADSAGVARTITLSGTLSDFDGANKGGFIKQGAGTLILNSSNTYTGSTTVKSGTLSAGLQGSIGNSSSVTVDSGATLDLASVTGGYSVGASQSLAANGSVLGGLNVSGTLLGSGTLASVTVNNGGVLAPGNNGVGTLNVSGSLSLQSGANTALDVNGVSAGTFDRLDVTGNFLQAGTLTLTLSGPLVNDTPVDLWGGTVSGQFSGIALAGFYSMQGGASFNNGIWSWATTNGQSWSLDAGTGALLAVPEPTTWATFAGGLGMLIMFHRRRSFAGNRS